MTRARYRFDPSHIIAVIVLIGCFGLMAYGINGIVHTVLLTVVVFFFGVASKVEKRPDPD
jgi:ABC-type nitrate/sulfonate/bicarbonate transport system permease component